MNRKILCVDDDPNILQGFKRALRKDFEIYLAEGGEEGLATIAKEGPFAVIVSDMRMPGMDGVQFLLRVKQKAPDSVRIMLTGNADQQTAMDAVNEGNIFRFLTKPCSPEMLAKSLNAGIEQYRLITAEKQLLEQTLNNSLQVMVEILALVNATAFSRSTRIKRLVADIARRVGIQNIWELEIAAMLSQLGCITVPEETLIKLSKCIQLTENELHLYQEHPQVGHHLIARIPRLETVAEIIAHQNKTLLDESKTSEPRSETAKIGAHVLKVVLDYDKLLLYGDLPHKAVRELFTRAGWYDQAVLNALKEIIDERVEEYVSIQIEMVDLKAGMILDESIVSNTGVALLTTGNEITSPLMMRLKTFAQAKMIKDRIQVRVPVSILENQAAQTR